MANRVLYGRVKVAIQSTVTESILVLASGDSVYHKKALAEYDAVSILTFDVTEIYAVFAIKSKYGILSCAH